MFKKIVSLFIVILLLSFSAFAHTAYFELEGTNRYKAVRLTPDVYNYANHRLSDILVKDASGNNVPYFINTSYQSKHEGIQKHPLELINSYTKDGSFFFDLRLQTIPSHDVISTSILFETSNTDFAKNVTLFGSYDNVVWEKITDSSIYNVDGNFKMFIAFDKPEKYTHFRLKLANNLEKITFNNMYLENVESVVYKNKFIETINPSFTAEEVEKETRIKVDGLKNLKINSIKIDTDSMFKRAVFIDRFNKNKTLFNLTFNETNYNDTTIECFDEISTEDVLVIRIPNRDDKPLNIKGITVQYSADEVVFEDIGAGPYTISFTGDANKMSPSYDISSYKNDILKQDIDSLKISSVTYDKIVDIVQKDYTLLFNVVITVVSLLLVGLILFKMKKK